MATVAPGTATEVYTLVARGALGCWFGADGPLSATHVFQAEAAPPAQGGAAEIVLHERDVSLRDQRGARALRISFTNVGDQVRVATAIVRIEPRIAEPMTKDVEAWANGSTGCQLRALLPASPAPPARAPARATGSVRYSR